MSDTTRETIPIASDHAGFEMKQKLIGELEELGYAVDDLGAACE